jgi:2-amino-4-hydroxy-6-hydroxymethyldihydropteridine diphosphokinase
MILLGLGANLPSSAHGNPLATLAAALRALAAERVEIVRQSRWYETAPVPVSDQPWYVNGVVEVATALAPGPLLTLLHATEAGLGRVRGIVNGARSADLDLLDYHGRTLAGWPVLPHPRLHERAFVLLPLRDVAPSWRHPQSGLGLDEMLARLGSEQKTRMLAGDAGLP